MAIEGQTTQPIEIDDALASLAMAQLGASQQFEEVLRWAHHPLTSTGGLVIAIVTDQDEAALRRTAALRQPEGTGVLILLDTASFARPRPVAPTDQTLALADMVAATGWSTCVVGSDMTVAQAWNSISAHNTGTVGARR
jgi:UDP-N-acetyl-D-mannosaminuronic acid transferase (WecB/TagA/CpsF family)